MALRMTDAGGQRFLNILFGTTAKDTSFNIQLFCGATAPTLADTDAANTFETPTSSQSAEVAAKALSNNATVGLNGSNIPQAAWAQQTWSFTAALTNTNKTIQGYQFIVGTAYQAGSTVLWEELLSTPVIPANGVSLAITPTFLAGNGVPE